MATFDTIFEEFPQKKYQVFEILSGSQWEAPLLPYFYNGRMINHFGVYTYLESDQNPIPYIVYSQKQPHLSETYFLSECAGNPKFHRGISSKRANCYSCR